MKRYILLIFISLLTSLLLATPVSSEFSKSGFFEVPNSGRQVYNFNIGWRFFKGPVLHAEEFHYDDNLWGIVNCPHGLEYVTDNASGSNNYQGEAWYRKHFTLDKSCEGRINKLIFEGVMGKCKVWINGVLCAEHFGGFLPFSINIEDHILWGEDNVMAVWVDNSDDPSYPPGKQQTQLDFSYFGGIYRDVFLVSTSKVFVTNPNDVDKVAGGGVFVHVEVPSDKEAVLSVAVDVQNDNPNNKTGIAQISVFNPAGKLVNKKELEYSIRGNAAQVIRYAFSVINPQLWSPWSPEQYRVEVVLLDHRKRPIDGVAVKTGLRKIEFKGKEGLYLNNRPYPAKLMGANRHQDHAIVGNALPNNGQWRDALLLKQAGCDIIRAAHYPADPAFMDACDALGIFFIVATPGWQFWNKDPLFEQRVISDIRNMVRRDRNHPSVIMWEPILNETHYPAYFAELVHRTVHEEYPFAGAYTACDRRAQGQEHFDVIYSQPYRDFFNQYIMDTPENRQRQAFDYSHEERCVFTREWGDCVDDWNAHNSPSRVARAWGERAQLIQSQHYAHPDYLFPCWETFYDTPKQHIGGAIWHSFDHQRGYHPHPFYGGITDIYRQPKYSYYMFASQRGVDEGYEPMIYIAHEMSPFSEPDVTVFTNCEEVRLIMYGNDTLLQNVASLNQKMPHPVVVFPDVFDFMDIKEMSRKRNNNVISIVAEGLIDGEVVARQELKPALRPAKIKLSLQNRERSLVANGADFVCVVASITDAEGNVKRLDESYIKFEVEGEGTIIGGAAIMANPRKVSWGTAPVLIRSTLKEGSITVKASILDAGKNSALLGTLTFSSIPSSETFIYNEITEASVVDNALTEVAQSNEELKTKVKALEQEIINLNLKAVEQQQQDFEGN